MAFKAPQVILKRHKFKNHYSVIFIFLECIYIFLSSFDLPVAVNSSRLNLLSTPLIKSSLNILSNQIKDISLRSHSTCVYYRGLDWKYLYVIFFFFGL